MMLVELADAVGAYLTESWQKTVTLDMERYDYELRSKLDGLYAWARDRHPEDEPTWDPKKEATRMEADTRKKMAKVASMIARVIAKTGIDVRATIQPMWHEEKDWRSGVREMANPFNAPTTAHIYFHKTPNKKPRDPSLTWFGPREIDDVLDAGDREFFTDPEMEAVYFKVVNELRNPGSINKAGKPTRVYTARPKKDRAIYDGAKSVPSGIFVTNDPDRAEGFGSDFGNTEGRDLWRIVVDSKYLVQTLKAGRVRDYQIVGHGKVPIKSIERLN